MTHRNGFSEQNFSWYKTDLAVTQRRVETQIQATKKTQFNAQRAAFVRKW